MTNAQHPRVSIVIPALDVEDTVESCIASALAQDWPSDRLEVVLVDNGSTDRTVDIASAMDVTVVHEPRRNRGLARNRGAAASSGDILGLLDADCLAPPNWISSLIASLSKPWIVAAQARVQKEGQAPPPREFAAAHYFMPFLDTCAMAVRRTAFDEAGGFHENLRRNEDMDFSFRLLARGYGFAWAPDTIVIKRHELTTGQAARRGWEAGVGTAQLQHAWNDWFGMPRRRVYRDVYVNSGRRIVRAMASGWAAGKLALVERTMALAAFTLAETLGRTASEEVDGNGPVAQALGRSRHLVSVDDGRGVLFDARKRKTTALDAAAMFVLGSLVDGIDDPAVIARRAPPALAIDEARVKILLETVLG